MITVGSRVGGYTVLHELGQGGMGRVYLAQHHRIERRAAVKVLLPELSANASVVERFFTEARATSLIRHPGIVEVLDCDVIEGQAFIVMEYLEGESLAAYLNRIGGLIGDRVFALAVVGQVAHAVAAAHARGIVHRDLKPDNVFLCASAGDLGVVTKVLDFGIAKLAQQPGGVSTRSGAILGTPAYMSPEQCRGGNRIVDGRSDVYALGCILYETLCGRPPFVRDGLGDMILAHVSEPPDPLRALVPQLPAPLDELAMRMLAKDPEHRPQSMEDVLVQITACLKALGVRAPIADIRPIEPVIVPVHGRAPNQLAAARTTPMPPAFGTTPPAAPAAQTPVEAASGATRILPVDSGAANALDFSVAVPAPPKPTTFRGAAGEAVDAPRSGRPARGRSALWLVLAGILGGGAVAAFALKGSVNPPYPGSDAPTQSAAGASDPKGAPGRAAPAASEKVTVDVRGLPPGAEVWLDGALTAGLPLRLQRDDRRHVLSLRADGFENRTVEIDALRDRIVDVMMGRAAPAENSEAQARDPLRARGQPAAGRDRAASSSKRTRRRLESRPDGKSGATPEGNQNREAITDI